MNKDKFIKMLEQAKEDEYGRLYVLGEYNNKIYFGTITTICEDIFVLNHSEECQDTAELYDRHFWNDDTLECYVVSTKHDEDIIYKEPKRIEEIKMIGCNMEVNLSENKTLLPTENLQTDYINLVKRFNDICDKKEELKKQQQEFIDYLEDMLDDDNDIFSVIRVKDVLNKYKEIIGTDTNVGSKGGNEDENNSI